MPFSSLALTEHAQDAYDEDCVVCRFLAGKAMKPAELREVIAILDCRLTRAEDTIEALTQALAATVAPKTGTK